MNVQDLIDELSQYPRDLEVEGDDPHGPDYEILGTEEFDEEDTHVVILNMEEKR